MSFALFDWVKLMGYLEVQLYAINAKVTSSAILMIGIFEFYNINIQNVKNFIIFIEQIIYSSQINIEMYLDFLVKVISFCCCSNRALSKEGNWSELGQCKILCFWLLLLTLLSSFVTFSVSVTGELLLVGVDDSFYIKIDLIRKFSLKFIRQKNLKELKNKK